jgi:DNA repair exonuclease SbcCD nuclease subunit
MKICHFADLHYNEKDHDEIEKCMDFLIDTAGKERPDVFICSGDITNSQYLGFDTRSAKTIARQFREMSDLAPVAVVVGTNSHDGMIPELLKNVSGEYPIHVSNKPEQIMLYELMGKKIWAISPGRPCQEKIELVVSQVPPPSKAYWKNKQGIEQDNQNISQAMGAIFAGFQDQARHHNAPHVLNGHFAMQGSMISETQMLPGGDIAIGKDILAMAGADAYFLGHIHLRQEYDLPGGTKAFHSGSIFRKDFGEKGVDKGFYIHSLKSNVRIERGPEDKKTMMVEYTQVGEGFSLSSDFIKTPTRHMAQEDFNLIERPWLLDDQETPFIEKILVVCKEWCNINAWLKIKITAYMDDVRQINQTKLKRDLLEAGAQYVAIEIDRVRRENSREEKIIKAVGLPEKVKVLADHRSQPMPEGLEEMLEKVETLSVDDLVGYGLGRI